MPDIDNTPPDLDFAGLATAAGQAFKPHFPDVEVRARRHRRNRAIGAALLVVGLTAGGTTAVAMAGNRPPTPVVTTPSPSATPGPWRTSVAPGSRDPAPQPSYIRIAPDGYDIAEPDQPLTGLWTELRAGDLDHLYLDYRACEGKACRRMLATSGDRGRTWRKLPLPADVPQDGTYSVVVVAHHGLVVASDSKGRVTKDPDQSPASFLTSVDGGATWKRTAVRDVDAVPTDWPVYNPNGAWIIAFDPATGDAARLKPPPESRFAMPIDTPAGSGIWMLGSRATLVVSRDGGRSWETRPSPKNGGSRNDLVTADGETVYFKEDLPDGNGIQLHVSTDGARTWQKGAKLQLGGPALSLLPLGGTIVQVEGPLATLRSVDGGRSFTKVGASLGSRAHPLPGGGYAIPTNNNEVSVWLSPDGGSWTYIGRPEVP